MSQELPMPAPQPTYTDKVLSDTKDFSLVLGGPLYQLARRAHLSDDALGMLRRRLSAITLLAWPPLLLLCAFDHKLLDKALAVPFLLDLETHIRFLIVVPLLVVAEYVMHVRMLPVARTFLDRKLIPVDAVPRFDAAVVSAFRLRDSPLAELVLLAIVYGVGVMIIWHKYTILDANTWYATRSAAGEQLSLAGVWYGLVSLPLFQFLLLRWYWRILIWTRFLWQVSRIQLTLVPTHPDLLGGLGFLANTVDAFAVLLAAHGAMLAGLIASRVFFLGATLPEFKALIGIFLVYLLLIVCGPLLLFSPQLARAKRAGLREYGTFAERYVREFDTKWLRRGAPADEALLGNADIQSLADMGNSFGAVRSMRLWPISRDAVILLGTAILMPILPLVLTMMPLEQLLRKLVGLVL
jgi:hypothetical protein